jgi:hypothetical protein
MEGFQEVATVPQWCRSTQARLTSPGPRFQTHAGETQEVPALTREEPKRLRSSISVSRQSITTLMPDVSEPMANRYRTRPLQHYRTRHPATNNEGTCKR